VEERVAQAGSTFRQNRSSLRERNTSGLDVNVCRLLTRTAHTERAWMATADTGTKHGRFIRTHCCCCVEDQLTNLGKGSIHKHFISNLPVPLYLVPNALRKATCQLRGRRRRRRSANRTTSTPYGWPHQHTCAYQTPPSSPGGFLTSDLRV